MASIPLINDDQHASHLPKEEGSKCTHVALITCSVVLFIIGVMASAGVFNSINGYMDGYIVVFSYGMYGGSAAFLICEIINVAINCCSKKNQLETVVDHNASLTNEPIARKELPLSPKEHNEKQKKIVERFKMIKYLEFTSALGSTSALPSGWKEGFIIGSYQFTRENVDEICEQIKDRIDMYNRLSEYTLVQAAECFDCSKNGGLVTVTLRIIEPNRA